MESYKIKFTEEIAKAAVLGGAFLGGGGGGSLENGLSTAKKALELGDLYLYSPDYLKEDDIVITASAVGSPASKEGYVDYTYCKRAYELLNEMLESNIGGVITNENGGHSTTNGWILSAVTGLPLIDAPCNGRAHPTGTMGSMGLTRLEDYKTIQIALGGKVENNKYLEMVVKGNLASTSALVRQGAAEAGGLVTVLRNPVKAEFLYDNAAIGGLKQAIDIGNVYIQHEGNGEKILAELKKIIPFEVIASGTVKQYDINIQGGFDVGQIVITADNAQSDFNLTFWNEYMTLECKEQRIATFPDLIATLDKETGKVLSSAEIKEKDNVVVVKVPKEYLKLGKGMFDQNLFKQAEDVINKELIKFIF